MTEEDYSKLFADRLPALQAMGEYVRSTVVQRIEEDSTIADTDEFLKIPPKYRVKDTNSFISKIFRKGKNYTDPINDITDQVGIRFVVLYCEDIKLVGQIIESNPDWEFSQDRDIKSEIEADPHHFSYQSEHYVVSLKEDLKTELGTITPQIKCEVQIRTLLQHAYAELAHDTTYKPSQEATPLIKRSVAKTSALIETTDNIFTEVKNTIADQKKPLLRIMRICEEMYEKHIDEPVIKDISIREQILLPYLEMLGEVASSSLDDFFTNNRVLLIKIKENRALSILFKCAEVLIIYFVVRKNYLEAKRYWEYDESLINQIYVDLGISYE